MGFVWWPTLPVCEGRTLKCSGKILDLQKVDPCSPVRLLFFNEKKKQKKKKIVCYSVQYLTLFLLGVENSQGGTVLTIQAKSQQLKHQQQFEQSKLHIANNKSKKKLGVILTKKRQNYCRKVHLCLHKGINTNCTLCKQILKQIIGCTPDVVFKNDLEPDKHTDTPKNMWLKVVVFKNVGDLKNSTGVENSNE